MSHSRKSKREVAKSLFDISASVREAATGLLEDVEEATVDNDSAVDRNAIIKRAENLRKKAFVSSNRRGGTSKTSKEERRKVMISVCKMKRGARGAYLRDGPFMECELDRSFSYDEILEAASKFLKMNSSARLSIYRPRGGVVLIPADINLNDELVSWTLGSYMRQRHAGPDAIQLGIGSADEVAIEKQSFSLEVRYGELVNDTVSLPDGLSRERLRSELNKQLVICFQPEHYEYMVIYIAEDGVPLYKLPSALNIFTSLDCLVARGYKEGTKLSIVYQSPASITCQGLEEIALYCVVNVLAIEIDYRWNTPNDFALPSTPVAYVTKPGIYFCSVRFNGEEVHSNPTEIIVLPGRVTTFAAEQAQGVPSSAVENETAGYSGQSHSSNGSCNRSANSPSFSSSGVVFQLTELLEATSNKKDILGSGGYGTVYKGLLRHTTVAIKFLNQEGQTSLRRQGAADTLRTELAALTKFRHPNIVSIMGYSPLHDAIVYEYIAGGSLYKRLHEAHVRIDWQSRLKVLHGTCLGLVYLHSGDVVHQDIKSANILVDMHDVAKITDFGFALELRQVEEGRSLYTAQMFARSEGYYPSELSSGRYSAKSDVYSLGVVMLETFSGQKAFCSDRGDPKLVDHLEDNIKSMEAFQDCQDQRLSKCDPKITEFMFSIIGKCLSRHSKRPTSKEVIEAWDTENID